MNKINITTWYEVELPDGEIRKFKADTAVQYNSGQVLQSIFDQHAEKEGAIERKLLTSHE